MTLKEDVKYIKSLSIAISVLCAIIAIMLLLTYGYVKDLSKQNSNRQEVEIVTYSDKGNTVWYKGNAEIVKVTESEVEYIDDHNRKRYVFFNEAVVTITKYK